MEYSKEKVMEMKKRKLLVFDEIHHVKFEPVYGCNLSCEFCGASRNERGIMTKETFLKAIEGLNEKFKMSFFSGHGEPTLNLNLNFFIRTLRERFPKQQINVISNLVVFKKEGFQKVLDLFDDGLSQLQADIYSDPMLVWFKDSIEKYSEEIKARGISLKSCYDTNVGAFSYKGGKKKEIVYTIDIKKFNSEEGVVRKFHNWAGNLDKDKWTTEESTLPMSRTCSEPFKYAYVFYDGGVTLCCRNGGRSLVYGNVHEKDLTSIWRSIEAQSVRLALKNGRRDLIMSCLMCDYRSFRDGLYPYWGEDISLEKVTSILEGCQVLDKKHTFYENLLEFRKTHSLPSHIENEIVRKEKEK